MDEKPKSIWKKSLKPLTLKLPGIFLAWLILTAAAMLLFSIAILIIGEPFTKLWNFIGLLILGAVVATILLCLWIFIRWLFCWRNFKRFLFGLACFATLIALFYAEEDWRGKHDWEKYKHEWEAKGEKFDFADFVPPAVPGDQNFALTPIVFTSYGQMLTRDGNAIPWEKRDTNFVNRLKMEIVHNYEDSPRDGNWQTAKISDLKAWRDYYRALAATTNEFPVAPQPQSPAQDVLLALSKYNPAIEELRQASQLPYSRFPLDYDIEDPAEILLPHLAALKQCSLALQLRAIAELQNGESEKALDDVKLALRLADSVHTEPFIITHLVRMAILQITLQPIYEGLAEHKWSDEQLAQLDSELAKLDFPADFEFSVRGERSSRSKIIDWLEQKRSRYWLLFDMVDSDTRNTMNHFDVAMMIYLMPKGWYYQNDLVLAQMEQQWNLPMVNDSQQIIAPQKARNSAVAINAMRPNPFNFFARLALPALGNYAQKTAYGQNAVNMARIAIALERYRLANGNYPDSLDAIAAQFPNGIPHDIINGQPLHYRRTSDGQFVLYSVGWNEMDDGGAVVFKKGGSNQSSPETDTDKGDWVWRYPSK
ncbi:MAG TPA: hypothetical protein VGM58_00665 [Verrucomicrobiae bacterium]|jgi:hypothetical protein